MFKKHKLHILYFSIFLLILFIFTFPITFKMNSAVYGPLYGTDNRAAIWHFWWFNYSFKNNLNVNTNTLTNYPFGIGDMGPKIYPLCIFPVYLISILAGEIFAYNAMILSSFILSFLCMYILVFYLTKKHSAAFISGLIYSLCPYHVNKSWEHFGLMFIEFIPLYAYWLLKLKDSPNLKNSIFCSLSLLLVVLSDLTYIYVISIFSALYLLFLLIFYRKDKIGLFTYIKSFIKMCVLASVIILPLLFFLFKNVLLTKPVSASNNPEILTRAFHYLFSQSASILAYLIPSKFHPIWGGLARALEGSFLFGRGSIEQTLYLGWIGIILFYIAIKKKKDATLNHANIKQSDFVKRLFLFILFSSIIFSMPPYWNLLLFKVYFPSFFLYKLLPVFRAYARFGVLAILSISILAGYGFATLLTTKKKEKLTTAIISLLIFVDFSNIPPARITEINRCPPVYNYIAEKNGNFAIVEYPLRLGDMSEGYENLDYLLYQRCHQKAIVNGAKPGTYAYEIKKKITRITDADTPRILSALGAKYVILHLGEYLQGNNKEAVDIVGEIPDLTKSEGLRFINKFEQDELYEIVVLPSNN